MRWIVYLMGVAMACSEQEHAASGESDIEHSGIDDTEASDSGLDDSGVGDSGLKAPDFATQVHPIFEAHCLNCHSSPLYGDLSTPDKAYAALVGKERGIGSSCGAKEIQPLVVAGDHENSWLWLVSVGTCEEGSYGMPKSNPLGLLVDFDPDAVNLIAAWIDAGALR